MESPTNEPNAEALPTANVDIAEGVSVDISQAVAQAERMAKLNIAERAKVDLYFLAHNILGYDLMEEHTHQTMCDYVLPTYKPHLAKKEIPPLQAETEDNVRDSYDPKKNFVLYLLPRGTFKSSVITIAHSIQRSLNDPDDRILIDSETFSKSKAFLAEIKGHYEGNDKLREIYNTLFGIMPDARKKIDIWSDSQLNLGARKRHRKEPSFSCAGVDVTKNGMHYDLIIMDDLHSEKNVTTKEQIDQVIQHYKLALSLLDPGCPLIVIGTRWHYADLYQYILDYERERFNILIRSAFNPDGSLFFPERLTEEFLETTKKTQGSYIFSCQYLNNPVDNETATFKRSYFRRVKWSEVEGKPINWYLMVDPSYEGPYSDYAAFVVAGMDFESNLYVRHITRQKMTYAEIIKHIFDINAKYELRGISLEVLATQKSITYELTNEQKRRGHWLRNLVEVKSRSKSKEERIRGLAPFYEFGRVFHIEGAPQLDELEYELLHFPLAKHDDVIDAFADILDLASPPSNVDQEARREKKRKRIEAYDKPRSPITGV